jgi:ABC-2 type transport system permease protein
VALPVYDSAQARRPLITELQNLWTYRGLIRLLVGRELTVRYKRSALGVWWTLLNPLITTAIMWLVFGQLFGSRFGDTGAEPYVLYLLAGVLFMTFFSQALLATGAAITGRRRS